MNALSSSQRKRLRGLAHGLKATVQIGQRGLTDGVLREIDEALSVHELIKVRFTAWKDRKAEICQQVCDRLGAELAGITGHVAVLYRPAADVERRRIELPEG